MGFTQLPMCHLLAGVRAYRAYLLVWEFEGTRSDVFNQPSWVRSVVFCYCGPYQWSKGRVATRNGYGVNRISNFAVTRSA